jgi:hypothetical protein
VRAKHVEPPENGSRLYFVTGTLYRRPVNINRNKDPESEKSTGAGF